MDEDRAAAERSWQDRSASINPLFGAFPDTRLGSLPGAPFTLPFGELAQGIDLMRTMWTQFLQSPIAPTLDPEELDRRIRDLKTVEQWLAVHQGLLRTTIQGLEIQRTTIATLQAVAGMMSRPLSSAPGSGATGSTASGSTAAGSSAAGSSASAASPSAPPPRNVTAAPSTPATSPDAQSTKGKPSGAAASDQDPVQPAAAIPVMPPQLAPAIEAAAQQAGQWWQFLHQQFRQLADAAAPPAPTAAGASTATEAPEAAGGTTFRGASTASGAPAPTGAPGAAGAPAATGASAATGAPRATGAPAATGASAAAGAPEATGRPTPTLVSSARTSTHAVHPSARRAAFRTGAAADHRAVQEPEQAAPRRRRIPPGSLSTASADPSGDTDRTGSDSQMHPPSASPAQARRARPPAVAVDAQPDRGDTPTKVGSTRSKLGKVASRRRSDG